MKWHIFDWVQKGRLSEAKGDLADAKKLYESSMAISPTHIKSLYRLVGVVVGVVVVIIHCVSKKTSHFVIVHIFVKYWPIFKIFSLAHFVDK